MNGSFRFTDTFLTSPESTFCPHFLFFDKKVHLTLKKYFYLENKANLDHFAYNTTYKNRRKKTCLYEARQNTNSELQVFYSNGTFFGTEEVFHN